MQVAAPPGLDRGKQSLKNITIGFWMVWYSILMILIRIDIEKYGTYPEQCQRSTAAIEQHITPHMFRRTFASSLLDADVDIRYIQEMLGHSSINTTQIYTHVTMAKQKNILTTKHSRNKFNF